jgi:hypothetical protein
MSPGASYPISKLIAKIISDSGLRRSEFVVSCGNKSVPGGVRKLDEWLQDGSGDEALAETKEIRRREHEGIVRGIEERERRRFRPFIWVHTVDGAHQFLTAIAERQVKVLWLPEGFEQLPRSERLAVVRRQIRDHYEKTGGSLHRVRRNPAVSVRRNFDTSVVLDTNGSVIEENGDRMLLPEVWLQLH